MCFHFAILWPWPLAFWPTGNINCWARARESWWTIPVEILVIALFQPFWFYRADRQTHRQTDGAKRFKVGFHYPSWRVSNNAPEITGRQLGPWTRVVETDLYSHDCMHVVDVRNQDSIINKARLSVRSGCFRDFCMVLKNNIRPI